MITLFGISIGLTEIIAILSFIATAVMAYAKIKNMLENIIVRNKEADVKIIEIGHQLDGKVAEAKNMLEGRLLLVEGRVSSQEERITKQEISNGRIDEKLLSIQSQLNRVLNFLEGRKND